MVDAQVAPVNHSGTSRAGANERTGEAEAEILSVSVLERRRSEVC